MVAEAKKDVLALDELVFHPWTTQGPRDALTFVRGSGSHVIDADGRRYLDFSSQLVFTNLGHQHPRVVAAIKEQADKLCTLAPGHASDIRGEAARLIVEVAPEGLGHVLFTTGGTEAIEHAVRMARVYTGRPKVLAAYRSYHGSTTTSIHLTGDPRRWASDTGAAGVVHFFGPFLYRSAFGSATPEQECERALEHLEQVILLEGPSTIAALVLEPVTGSSGVSVPPAVTCAGCGISVAVMASSSSPTKCSSDSAGRVPGSASSTAGWPLTSWSSRRASIPDTSLSGVCSWAIRSMRRSPNARTPLASPTAGTRSRVLQPSVPSRPCTTKARSTRRGVSARTSSHLGSARSQRPTPASETCVESEHCGPSNSSATVGPGSRSYPWAPRARPTHPAAVARACLERELLPLILGNRVHVAPPLNVSDSDAATALATLDEALTVADEFLS